MLLRRIRISFSAVRYISAASSTVESASKTVAPVAVVNTSQNSGVCFSVASSTVESASKPVAPAAVASTSQNSGGRDTLGRRLLSLIYTKRSAVITIQKWKEEGHTVRKYELNRIVRELRKLKRYKHALEICEWMRTQEDIKLLEGDYAVHLDLIAKIRGLNSAEKFFEDLPDQMKGKATCTALLHTYVQHKESSKAEALMEKMSECGFLKYALPYNHLMSLYISNGELAKALGMIPELKKNTSPDIVTYNLWLSICASQDDSNSAEKVFLELKKAKVDPDWVTYSTLTSIYIKNSFHEKAAATLKEMEKKISRKVRVAYASIISLHTSLGNKDEVQRMWKKMKSIFRKLNDAEYICMISSLLKLDEFDEAENIYKEWESISVTNDCRVPNLILSAYIKKNHIEKAEQFHNQMVKKGVSSSYTTWELLTLGYLKQKDIDKALDSFKKAVTSVKKWDLDEKMVRELFRILQEHANVEHAEELLVILRHAGHVNTEIYNMLLQTYVEAKKMPLIVSERMKKDKVQLDDKTHELIKLTSNMCISEVSSCLS